MGLHLGDIAPNFTAVTTDGEIDFHAWKEGKWAVFFSHPADYTPVCTTELSATAKLNDEFVARGVKTSGTLSARVARIAASVSSTGECA